MVNSKAIKAQIKAIAAARKQLETLEAEFEAARLEAIRSVAMTKVGDTVTLTFGNQVYKAKKNRFGRWNVKKDGVLVVEESLVGIHDIRFAIAMGEI